MLRDPAFDRVFAAAVEVMRPYLGDIICIGGCANALYRHHGVMVRVPNPAAYVVQKVLIRDQRRKIESRAKDCYYMYEVSVVFRDNLAALGREYDGLHDLPAPWMKRFAKGIRTLFRDEHAEGATSALDVHEGSGIDGPRLSAGVIQRAVAKMLDAMGVS